MVTLIARLNGIARMSAELIQQLYNIVTDKAFKKGHILLKAGEICRNIYFIEKGLVASGPVGKRFFAAVESVPGNIKKTSLSNSRRFTM